MSSWGRNDKSVTANSVTTVETSNGAPMGVYTLVKGDQVSRVDGANAHFGNTSAGTRAKVDVNLFNNTTIGAFIPNQAVGVFGVDPVEMGVTSGKLVKAYVTNPGSGYGANASVTLTVTQGGSSGVVNALASATGRIDSLLISTVGSGYVTPPKVTVDAPSIVIFNGNTAVSATNQTISISSANSLFLAGDKVVYAGNTLSTPGGLVDNNTYYVSFSNTTVIKLAATKGGANIAITKAPGTTSTAAGATVQGERAEGGLEVGGAKNTGVAHAGWVVRREGTGGRAGRVHYETLVAMGSLGRQEDKYGTPVDTTDSDGNTFIPPNND